MKTRISVGIVLALAAFLAFAQGCAPDKNYNLKDMDTEVTVLKGVSMPLPNLKEVKLGDLIKSSTSNVFGVNSDGEYVVQFKMDPKSLAGFSLNANSFSVDASGSSSASQPIGEYTVIPANTPLGYDESDKDALQQYLEFIGFESDIEMLQKPDFRTQALDYSFDVDFSIDNFPKEVSAVKSAALDGGIGIKITPAGIPFTKIQLKSGSRIILPSFIRLSSCDNACFAIGENKYTLISNSDVDIPVGTGLELNLGVSAIDFGENGISPSGGKLPLQSNISVKDAEITLDPSDFNGPTKVLNYPKNPATAPTVLDGSVVVVESDTEVSDFTLSYSYAFSITTLNSVTMKVSSDAAPSFEESYGFDVTGLPDFLSGNNVKIELAEIQVGLSIDSTFPLNFDLSGKIQPLDDNGPIAGHEYPIGPLTFFKESKTVYSLGELPDGESGGVIYKHVEGLGKILNPLPKRVEAGNFTISLPQDWVTIPSGQSYGGQLEVSLDAPLSFTSQTSFSLGVDFAMDLDMSSLGTVHSGLEAILEFDVTNTIPLEFEVGASAYDPDGVKIESVTSQVDGSIKAGNISSPSSGKVQVNLVLDTSKKISKLKLDLGASSNEEVAGTRLNQNQGLTLSNLCITLPKGVTADIKAITTSSNNN